MRGDVACVNYPALHVVKKRRLRLKKMAAQAPPWAAARAGDLARFLECSLANWQLGWHSTGQRARHDTWLGAAVAVPKAV